MPVSYTHLVTTYSEVTGAMSLTKITNPQVIRIAAFSAILFSVIGKILSLIHIFTAVIVSMKAKGLLKLIPIFCGIIVGYLAAWLFYDLDLSGVRDAAWIGLPQFVFPKFSWEPVLFMIPVAIAPVIEHIGDVYVVNLSLIHIFPPV